MRTKFSLRTSLAAIFLLTPASAMAQSFDETIIVTAARTPIPASDSTASISLLTADDLDARGAVFIADALRSVPGLAVSKSGPAGSLTQIRARGSEANHLLVLIDGVEATNPFTGETDFAHMAFDDIASIEVARGEQSALWGADAIGGVVHLTRAHPVEGRSGRLRLETGSLDTRRASASLASGFGRGYLSVNLAGFESDGIDVSGLGGEEDGYSSRMAGFAGAFQPAGNLRFDANLRWVGQTSEFDSDIDFDGRLDNTDSTRRGDQVFAHIGLNFDQMVGDAEWSHSAGLQLTDDASRSFSGGVRSAYSLGQRLQGHYEVTARWDAGAISHRLTGLAETERDRTKNDGGPGSLANQSRVLETTAFAFDYGLGRGPLDLTVSARQEQNNTFEDATTWRVGGVWSFVQLNGRIRLSGGEGVKNPGVFELFGFFPAFFVGNPDLTPERSQGWELGWEQAFAGDRGRWSAVWFQSTLQDEIYTDFSSFPATARNATTDSDRRGLELEGRWDFSDTLRVFGSATFLESEQNGSPEIRRPERLASLTLDWRPANRMWSASMTADHTGDQTDTDFGTFLPVTLSAYTLVGGQARWQFNEGVEIYVRGENLLDEDYQDVFGFHTQGRGLYLGIRLRHG